MLITCESRICILCYESKWGLIYKLLLLLTPLVAVTKGLDWQVLWNDLCLICITFDNLMYDLFELFKLVHQINEPVIPKSEHSMMLITVFIYKLVYVLRVLPLSCVSVLGLCFCHNKVIHSFIHSFIQSFIHQLQIIVNSSGWEYLGEMPLKINLEIP